MSYRLTNSQKWQLALSVFVVYWPIRLYANGATLSWFFSLRQLPFWILEPTITIVFFYCWLTVTEWLQNHFFHRFGDGFLIEFKIPTQIATLVIASALALSFNSIFAVLWHTLDETIEQRLGLYHYQEIRPPRPQPTARTLEERQRVRERRRRTNNSLTVMAMLAVFYLSANRRANHRLEVVQLRAERLEKENLHAQFAALKSQVNPHFLFNSLSILSSLVHIDPELSEKFIDQLSRAYRYILEQKDNERISLKTELDFIQSYRFLLNIRFESKFDIFVDVSEAEQNQYSIAPLTLQLLVENAVKHNRMSTRDPLFVYIYVDDESLVVQNTLAPRPTSEEASTGVGLQNIITRYALLTDVPVWVGESEGNFLVKIPLLPNTERITPPVTARPEAA